MREFKLRTSQRPRPLPTGRWTAVSALERSAFCPLARSCCDCVRHFLPEGLQPDTFQGSAWIGIVPLWMDRFNFRGMPSVPGYAQLSRTALSHLRSRPANQYAGHLQPLGRYRQPAGHGGGAARSSRLPCNWAEMRLNQRTEREFSFYSRRLLVSQSGDFQCALPGTGSDAQAGGDSQADRSSISLRSAIACLRGIMRVWPCGRIFTRWLLRWKMPKRRSSRTICRQRWECRLQDQEPVLHYSRRLAVYVWPAELAAPAYAGVSASRRRPCRRTEPRLGWVNDKGRGLPLHVARPFEPAAAIRRHAHKLKDKFTDEVDAGPACGADVADCHASEYGSEGECEAMYVAPAARGGPVAHEREGQ